MIYFSKQALYFSAVFFTLLLEISCGPGKAKGEKMELQVGLIESLTVGKGQVFESPSPVAKDWRVVFEDDKDTGYFYALDMTNKEMPIKDALHIYNTKNVSDKHLPSEISIVWTKDGTKAILMINKYGHAVIDFKAQQAFCRTGFPEPSKNSDWSKAGHGWNEAAYTNLFH